MHNKKFIIPMLLIVFAIFSAPFWLNLGKGTAVYPKIVLPTGADMQTCIEDKDWMRAEHMQLLNAWRDMAVRQDMRTYVASDGRKWEVSLQNTCLKCHSDKVNFCDTCHLANSVEPYCWSCHIIPGEGAK